MQVVGFYPSFADMMGVIMKYEKLFFISVFFCLFSRDVIITNKIL